MSEIIVDFFASLPEELYVLVVSLFPIIELRGAIPLGAGLGMPFYTNYICSVIGNLIPIPFILLFISKFLDFLSRFKRTKPLVDWLRRKADKHSSKVLVEDKESESAEATATESIEAAVAENSEIALAEIAEKSAVKNAELAVTNSAELAATESAEVAAADSAELATAESAEVATTDSAEVATADGAAAEKQKKFSPRAMSAAVFWALTLFVAIPLPGTGAWTGSLVAALFGLPKRKSFLAVTLGVLISGVIMCLASYGVVGFLQIFA